MSVSVGQYDCYGLRTAQQQEYWRLRLSVFGLLDMHSVRQHIAVNSTLHTELTLRVAVYIMHDAYL